MEFRLLVAALLAVAVLRVVLAVTHRGEGDAIRSRFDLALGAIVIGLAAGRVAAMALGGTNPLTRPGDLLIVRGGVDTAVAAIAGVLAVVVMARRRTALEMGALAPAALAGLAAWHAACTVRGACLGTPSNLPWAWAEPGSTVTRHPVELYAALALAGVALLSALACRRGFRPGVVAGAAIALAAAARLVTEPMRPVIGGSRAWFYLAALVAGIVVASADAWWGRRAPRPSVHS
jgi:prolipoprotein diacylglyceryltransferase